MAEFNTSQLDEIRSRIDLGELIQSYGVEVRRMGSGLKCRCPFHNEKTPSFMINVEKGLYHCFGCGAAGSAFTFVQQQEGLTFREAVHKLAKLTGVKLNERADPEEGRRARLYALMSEAAMFYHRCLGKASEAELARTYVAGRSLDSEIADKYLIGYAPKGMANMSKWAGKYGFGLDELEAAGIIKAPAGPGDSGYHRFGGRLMFPIADRQGRVVAFSGRQLVEDKRSGKYVNSPETVIFKKSRILYGFDKAAAAIARHPHREVIVCEGQIDCIRLQTSGFANSVASQGTAFTADHAAMLKRVADTALLCFDDDGAGHKATVRTATVLMAAGIPARVVSLTGGNDPDSFILRQGPDAFRQMLEDRAESIVAFQVRIERAKERNPDAIDAVNRVAKAVLGTIATSSNAVLKASLLAEAAKLLNIPVVALNEELSKLKVPPSAKPEGDYGDLAEVAEPPAELAPEPGRDAHGLVPPSKLEQVLMELLHANPGNERMALVIKGRLPAEIFESEFAAAFVDAWLKGGLDAFARGLKTKAELDWYAALELGDCPCGENTLAPEKQLQDLVRSLWVRYLDRCRFNAADPRRQLEMQLAGKRLKTMPWPRLKEFIAGFRLDAMQGGQQ